MRIAAANSSRRTGGFSLLEIILVLAIALTLSAVLVPAVGGWITERRLRGELERFADLVADARHEAEASGEPRRIWIGPPPPRLQESAGAFVFIPSGGFDLLRQDRKGNWGTDEYSHLKIEAGGIVSPRPFRLQSGDNFYEFRFDPLTGHLVEQGYSL